MFSKISIEHARDLLSSAGEFVAKSEAGFPSAVSDKRGKYFNIVGKYQTMMAKCAHVVGGDFVPTYLTRAVACHRLAFEFGEELDPSGYLEQLSQAVAVDQRGVRLVLAGAERSRYASNPTIDEMVRSTIDAYKAAVLGDWSGCAEWLRAAAERGTSPDVKKKVREWLETPLALIDALRLSDAEKLATAIEARTAWLARRLKRDPYDPDNYLDTMGAAVLRLARERGMAVPDATPFIPRSLTGV